MKRLPAPFSIESFCSSALEKSAKQNRLIQKKFIDNSVTKTLQNILKPESKDQTFTWEEINDSLLSVLDNI